MSANEELTSKGGQPEKPMPAGLLQRARDLGATAAAALPARALVVADHFAALCAAPHRCPSYGLAPGCPPHSQSPARFRAELSHYQWVLVFRIDVPAADLRTGKRLEVARRIHALAATLEGEALTFGFARARGLAAGSCFELYCAERGRCAVLNDHLPCPFADRVRPSLSAVGVDFTALTAAVHWPLPMGGDSPDPAVEPVLSMLAGLVLLAD